MANHAVSRIGDIAARNPTGALVGLLVSSTAVAGLAAPSLIRFRTISVVEFTELLVPAFMAALFIERVIEVLVSIARGEDRRQLCAASEAAERRANERNASKAKGDAATAARLAGMKLAAFQSETQNVALVFGVALGVVLSVLGVRVLEQLVQVDVLAGAPAWQQSGFRMFDVVVTGGLIGGGADGMHKLVSVFTTKFDQLSDVNRRARQKKRGA